MNEINRGSEWRKWDLHIHTPYSINQQYVDSTDGWNKFINALENLPSEVKVIGITDYYFIEGYKKVMEFRKNGRLKNIDKIFPILEFRIDTFGTASENDIQKINLHILFDVNENDLQKEIEKIKKEFIEIIPITKLPQHLTKMLTKENLTNEGNNLQNGFSNLIPSTEKVFELINSKTWKDKTFLFLGFKEWSNLEKNQQLKPFKEQLYNDVQAFFSNGYETNSKNQEWLNKFGNKRLLHSLDIHGFDLLDTYEFDNVTKKKIKNYKCFTWIKADTTFEGLKQIIYEPNERVKIQKEEPESEKLDNLIIDEVSFHSSNDKFSPVSIKLNKNLNVIIGGKSSGKSILLYEIAKTLYADRNDAVLKYKDVEDNQIKDLYDLSREDNDFNFTVKLFSGSSQTVKDRNSNSSILPSIKYIPQNHLSNLVDKSRKNGSTLKKIIRDLILEEPDYKKKYIDFVGIVQKNDAQRNQDIEYYFSLKEEIIKKTKELTTRGDKKSLDEGITFNKKKIQQLNQQFSKEDLLKYNSLIAETNLLNIKENAINSDYEKIKLYTNDLKRVLNEYLSRNKIVVDSIETEIIKHSYENKFKFIGDALEKTGSIGKDLLKDLEGNFIIESEFKTLLITVKNQNEKIEEDLKPYVLRQENKKQIEVIQKSISDDETKLSEIKQFEKEIDISKQTLIIQKEKIFKDFENNFREYENILENLKPRISSIGGQDDKVEIIGTIKYKFPEFRRIIDSICDGRSFNNKNFEYLYQYDNIKSALSEIDFLQIKESLKNLFERIEDNKLLLKNINQKEACKKVLKDCFFDHWDVKSDNDDIHKMSTGKASFILLKLIIKLSKDKGPILIDQPEDNLDNRSVSKELVEYLKDKKRERQIILVTHNPNIVVNADAENIIVANQKGQNDIQSESPYWFDYLNGSLENTFSANKNEKDLLKSMGIREHIADIVEGGEEAFKKREKKYGF